MSFTPPNTLAELSKIAGFTNVDELVFYSNTSRQNLFNWNKKEDRQKFLQTVILGAQVNKHRALKAQNEANR